MIFFLWLLHFEVVQSAVIQIQPEEPFSSNKNPERVNVASLANHLYQSMVTQCEDLSIKPDLCDQIRSTKPSNMNIYWAKSDNKTGLRVSSSNGETITASQQRNILAIKPMSTNSSPVFILLIGNPLDQSTCLKDQGKITDHGQGRCRTLCIQRYKLTNPVRTNLCTANSLPLAYFAVANHERKNLIKCIDGIVGAAPC